MRSDDVPARGSAPLAALGLVLAVLSLAGLAAGSPEPEAATVDLPDAGPAPTQVPRLLEDKPVDLNRATEADLRLLPRIGPTLAARIVENRAEMGCFREVRDLTRVRGIGSATLERLEPLLAVESGEAECGSDP